VATRGQQVVGPMVSFVATLCDDRAVSDAEDAAWVNTDVPLESGDRDDLGRCVFADRVAQRIAAAGTGPSIVFGLAGRWGSGKSSTLNMIREHFETNFADSWTVAELTPWSATDAASLMDEFYNCIADAMPPNKTGEEAARKLRAMAPVGVAVGKALGRALIDKYAGQGATADIADAAVDSLAERAGEYRYTQDPFTTRFKKVSSSIKEAGRNFLVVVDDVDRLHVDEVLALFKAVRLLGRFESVHYLLSYDEQTILDVLQASDIAHEDSARAAAYLEKIIQYPFRLPPIQDEQLERHLRTRLSATGRLHGAADQHGTSEDRSGDSISLILRGVPKADRRTRTLRSVNRLITQVDILLSLAGQGELDFVDTVLITHLRMQHRQLYDGLPQWRSDLTGIHSLSFASTRSDPDWKARIAENVGLRGDDPLVDQLVALLGVLFPRVRQLVMSTPPAGSCRIFEGQYFDRYFAFGIPEADIADATVRTEFGNLCNSGVIAPGSAIADALSRPQSWSPVLDKVRRNLDTVDQITPDAALSASIAIGREVHSNFPRLSGCLSIVARLLHRAVTAAATTPEASQYVNEYSARFGIVAAAHVLTAVGRVGDDDTMVPASQAVRAEVLIACKRDLATDLDIGGPSAPRIIDFLGYLNDEMWDELRAWAAAEIIAKRVTEYQLAARFVRTAEPHFETGPYVFLSTSFVELVALERWEESNLPELGPDEFISGSGDLEERIKYAAQAMKDILATTNRRPGL
jgi:hypothetical protein